MNVRRALALAPRVQKALREALTDRQYQRILVNLGRDYLRALEGFYVCYMGSRFDWGSSAAIEELAERNRRLTCQPFRRFFTVTNPP